MNCAPGSQALPRQEQAAQIQAQAQVQAQAQAQGQASQQLPQNSQATAPAQVQAQASRRQQAVWPRVAGSEDAKTLQELQQKVAAMEARIAQVEEENKSLKMQVKDLQESAAAASVTSVEAKRVATPAPVASTVVVEPVVVQEAAPTASAPAPQVEAKQVEAPKTPSKKRKQPDVQPQNPNTQACAEPVLSPTKRARSSSLPGTPLFHGRKCTKVSMSHTWDGASTPVREKNQRAFAQVFMPGLWGSEAIDKTDAKAVEAQEEKKRKTLALISGDPKLAAHVWAAQDLAEKDFNLRPSVREVRDRAKPLLLLLSKMTKPEEKSALTASVAVAADANSNSVVANAVAASVVVGAK